MNEKFREREREKKKGSTFNYISMIISTHSYLTYIIYHDVVSIYYFELFVRG